MLWETAYPALCVDGGGWYPSGEYCQGCGRGGAAPAEGGCSVLGLMRFWASVLLAFAVGCLVQKHATAQAISIRDAIEHAVRIHPGVGEVAANRRATEAEMRQQQGVLLPQVRLQVDAGPERLKRDIVPAPASNGQWMHGRE